MNELIIKKPRITEKSGLQAEQAGIYTFEVTAIANKKNIAKAISEIYKVIPVNINITKLPVKKVLSRGKKGTKSGVKKAVVRLKAGDKIDFV